MSRATQIINSLEETIEKTALVHPDHVENLEKRLKHKKIPHHKHDKPTYFNNIAYTGFGIRPEAWQPFMRCCDEVGNESSSSNPVTVSAAQSMGGAGGAGTSSVGSAGGVGGGETGP